MIGAAKPCPPIGGHGHGPLLVARRVLRTVGRLVAAIVCVGVVALAVSVLSGRLELLPVLSGSMAPKMPTGSLAIAVVAPLAALRVGRVAVFHPPGQPKIIYLHRVIWLAHHAGHVLVRTKGDANPVPDPWTLVLRGRSIFIVRGAIPDAGWVALWVHSSQGRAVILMVAGLLAMLLVAWELRDRRRRSRLSSAASVPEAGPLDGADVPPVVGLRAHGPDLGSRPATYRDVRMT